MAGGGVQTTIGSLSNAPDYGLVGRKYGIQPRRKRKASFTAERDAFETPADEIGIRVHLPGCRPACQEYRRGRGEEQRGSHNRPMPPGRWSSGNCHSFTSMRIVFEPETAA